MTTRVGEALLELREGCGRKRIDPIDPIDPIDLRRAICRKRVRGVDVGVGLERCEGGAGKGRAERGRLLSETFIGPSAFMDRIISCFGLVVTRKEGNFGEA
jgi:hypothetical protein